MSVEVRVARTVKSALTPQKGGFLASGFIHMFCYVAMSVETDLLEKRKTWVFTW
jgi:hypothetical protein